jgi:predicted Zn-dependent protease
MLALLDVTPTAAATATGLLAELHAVTIAISLQALPRNVSAMGNDLTSVPIFGALGSSMIRVDGVMIGGSGVM